MTVSVHTRNRNGMYQVNCTLSLADYEKIKEAAARNHRTVAAEIRLRLEMTLLPSFQDRPFGVPL